MQNHSNAPEMRRTKNQLIYSITASAGSKLEFFSVRLVFGNQFF